MIEALSEKAEEIYYSALEIKLPLQRQAFLDRVCNGDALLREKIEKLLASQPEADKFFAEGGVARIPLEKFTASEANIADLDKNSNALCDEDEQIGKYIKSYKLLQKIGEGGCGVVYMAEQEKPVRRRVALKIIKLGMDTKNVVARFEAERQALALMDHPNIARVLDAGATELGRPFFVMELVRGIEVTKYCDQCKLDTCERLKLFIRICHAVQHAHHKGVIHRDIKPSNILVTIIDGLPVPKVIDFGIAKAIEGRLADNTIFTAFEQFIGTPAYMSPEQALMSGVDVDTRSDIYSLGVLLYELLTGRTPFETKELLGHGIDGLRRTLQDEEPKRPSVIVSTIQGSALREVALSRQVEPLKLASLLRGDLDWIVIRALEKDRSRRYQTANGLAMDIQRFIDNEPVVARPPTRLYRLQKLVRRNKVTFLAGTVVALSLIGGLAAASWSWRQEYKARKRAVEAEHLAYAAEQQQALLRMQAENRERITQADFLISQNKISDADKLVKQVIAQQPTLEPSLEVESVLRSVGVWHALNGRWPQAAECFNLLLDVDRKDNSWATTTDMLMAGPILIEMGDMQGYESFRQAAIARYQGTADPVFAERTLKICLLSTTTPRLMESLEPLYELSAGSMKAAEPGDIMASWRCISLALMEYRQGNVKTSMMWCQKCLSDKNNPARIATAHVIQAMSYFRLGDMQDAKEEFEVGQKMVETKISNGLDEGNGLDGFWYDWLFARILLHEADTLFKTPIPVAKPSLSIPIFAGPQRTAIH
jgi:eukaryotic-like serine/threonine-protein kinase